jgi:hypothetical protein
MKYEFTDNKWVDIWGVLYPLYIELKPKNYTWDIFRDEKLEEMGLRFIPTTAEHRTIIIDKNKWLLSKIRYGF